jgi:hypothetical protein
MTTRAQGSLRWRIAVGALFLVAASSVFTTVHQALAQPPRCVDYVCGDGSDCQRHDCEFCEATSNGTKRCAS